MKIEKVTTAQLRALERALSPVARMVSGLGEVDVGKGRGVLDESGRRHCLWTRDGHRVTVVVASDGGLIVSKSKEPDPECPKGKP